MHYYYIFSKSDHINIMLKEVLKLRRREVCSGQFSSVPYGIYALGKAHMRSTLSQEFPQRCPWDSSNVGLTDDGPFSSSEGRSLSASSFYAPPFQAIGGCDVFGFVPAGSFSSSSTLKIFRDASRLWWLFCPPICLLSHWFPASLPALSPLSWEVWEEWTKSKLVCLDLCFDVLIGDCDYSQRVYICISFRKCV